MPHDPPSHHDGPLAYLLTWTTYGTWLPGDDRGWHSKDDADTQDANPLFAEVARSRMTEPEFRLSAAHRQIVEETVRKHCRVRGWSLHAINARTNHVHVVVSATGYKPETVRDQLKAWCTRKLKEAGETQTKFWTEGGGCRCISDENGLEGAVLYVTEAQDRKGEDDAL